MERAEVEAGVKKAIARVLKIEESEIDTEANFSMDLGADSMQSLELVAAFEEEFDISMDEDAALGVQTVAGAIGFIKEIVDQIQ